MALSTDNEGKRMTRKWAEDRATALVHPNRFTTEELAWLDLGGTYTETFYPSVASPGGWSNPLNALTRDGNLAHVHSTIGIADIGGWFFGWGIHQRNATIDKVEIGARWYVSDALNVNHLDTGVSWDNNVSWSPDYPDTSEPTALADFWTDVTSATTWNWQKLSDPNLLVWVSATASAGVRIFHLDCVMVRITYTLTTSESNDQNPDMFLVDTQPEDSRTETRKYDIRKRPEVGD